MGWKDTIKINTGGEPRNFAPSPDALLAAELNSLLDDGAVRTGSRDFASSMLSGFKKYGRFTDKQRPYVEKIIAEAKAPKPVESAPAAEFLLDVSKVPSGYYAVDSRRYKIDNVAGGKWDGWVFVKDGSAYAGENGEAARRVGSQRPGSGFAFGKNPRTPDFADIRSIIADPLAAMKQYGKITGTCGRCGRILENPESVAAGIGPVCAELM